MTPAPAPDPSASPADPSIGEAAGGSARRAPEPLWRRESLRRVGGGVLRPGGLDLTDRMAELAGLAPRWRVLDVGCGSGAAVRRLRARHGALAVGLDATTENFPPQGDAPAPLARGDMARLPFADDSFHMLFCECVLSLARDPAAVLTEFARVLRPGGWLGLSDLYQTGGPNPGSAPGCAAGARPLAELEALLVGAGFALVRFEDHSDRLRELAAQMVLAGESLEGLCACHGAARPGYCVLVARTG